MAAVYAFNTPLFTYALEVSEPQQELAPDLIKNYELNYYERLGQDICAGGGGSVALHGDSNFVKITNYFASVGLKDIAIAGILANLFVESNLSAFAVQGQVKNTADHRPVPEGPRDGYGIAQFTPASKIGSVLQRDSRTADHYSQYYSTKYGGYGIASWNEGGTGIPEGVPEAVNDAWLHAQLDFFYEGEMQSTKVSPYRDMGGKMGLDYIPDHFTILEALNFAKNEEDAARIFVWIYERPGNKPETALDRQKFAKEMLPSVQQALITGPGGHNSINACSPSSEYLGQTGKFAETVKAFAWEDGRRVSQQKPAYTAALVGRYQGGKNGNDCGAFVSALMVKSGFDTSYPGTNTANQIPWLSKNWTKVAGVGEVNVADLRPGDVAIKPGHVFVWIGDVEGFISKSAEAALGSNTAPTAITSGNTYSAPSKYTWYRKKSTQAL